MLYYVISLQYTNIIIVYYMIQPLDRWVRDSLRGRMFGSRPETVIGESRSASACTLWHWT